MDPKREEPMVELEMLRARDQPAAARHRLVDRILDRAEPLLARRRRQPAWWDVLAEWARPGLVAASLFLALLIGAVRMGGAYYGAAPPSAALDEVLTAGTGSAAVPAWLVAANEPDVTAVLETALQNGDPNASELTR